MTSPKKPPTTAQKGSTMPRRSDYPEWKKGTQPAGWGERVWVQKDMFDLTDRGGSDKDVRG